MARKKTNKRAHHPPSPKTIIQSPPKHEAITEVKSPPKHEAITEVKSPPKYEAIPDSLLITQADLCSLLKISRSTLARMEKQIPSSVPGRVIIGGSVRYHLQVIESWLLELTK